MSLSLISLRCPLRSPGVAPNQMPKNPLFGNQAGYNGIPEAKWQVTLNEVTTGERGGLGGRVNSYGEFKSVQSSPGASEPMVSVRCTPSLPTTLPGPGHSPVVIPLQVMEPNPGSNVFSKPQRTLSGKAGAWEKWVWDWPSTVTEFRFISYFTFTVLHLEPNIFLSQLTSGMIVRLWVQIPTLSHSSSVMWCNSFYSPGLQFPKYRMEGTWENEVLVFFDLQYS